MNTAPRPYGYSPTISTPKRPGTWIGCLVIGAALLVFGNVSLFTAMTSPSVDVGAIVNGILALFGLGLIGVGLPFVIAGIVLRLRPSPTLWRGLND